MKKKIVSVLLATAMAVTLAGCGGGDDGGDAAADSGDTAADAGTDSGDTGTDSTDAGDSGDTGTDSADAGDTGDTGDVEKPESIKLMFDGTVFTEENGRQQFFDKLTELTGIQYELVQPDHDAYYDVVGQTMSSGDWPDVLILSSNYIASYGDAGVLWDMAPAWEASDLKKRQEEKGGIAAVEPMMIDGHLYGMPAARGNGCVTYVKQEWLDAAGITELPKTWDEFYDMLKKMKEAKGVDFVEAASGFLNAEAPYTNYLPEFYQDAWPSFYQKDDGTWADGFTEEPMKAAMERIAQGVKDGVLDKESTTYATSDVRNKFYDDSLGVFTYWAGTWATNIKTNCEANGLSGDIVALEPIQEVGKYIERLSPAWCITSTCKNPEGVFKYFIEAMQDGGDVQFLWTYGVEGTHWSTAAETLYADTEEPKEYQEGEFHMLDNLETPGTQYTKAHIDPMLALTNLANDPQALEPEAKASLELFNSSSEGTFMVPSTDEMNQYNGDLMTKKQELVTKVALGEMTVDEAYADFESSGAAQWSQLIVDSLNAQ